MTDPSTWAATLTVVGTAIAYGVSASAGRIVAAAALLVLAGGAAGSAAPGSVRPVALERLGVLGAVVLGAEARAGRVRRTALRLQRAEEEQRHAERRLAEQSRIARALAAATSGLPSVFEPERALQRFASLLRTLLRAEAGAVLVAAGGSGAFRLLAASVEGTAAPREFPETPFAVEGIPDCGVQPMSFSPGEAGRFGARMRAQWGCSTGYVAPILRGKQIAGALVVGYADAGRGLGPDERAILSGGAALCAALLESWRLHRELRACDATQREFLRTVSHELRTPLNAVIGYCDLLRDGLMGELNGEQREALDRLKHQAVDLAERIGAILEVDRLEAGPYVAVDWAECDLDAFFRQVQQRIPSHWVRPGVALRFSGRAQRTVRTDAEKLELALRSLVHNALKFTPSGSVEVEMSVSPGTLMFTVTDTGVGLAPEVREGLLRMFQAADPSPPGMGLGLYLTARMVRALWGQLSIESEPGRGTTARIALPIEEPAEGGIARSEGAVG